MNYLLTEANQNTFVLVDCIGQEHFSKEFFTEVHAFLIKEKRDDALILKGKKNDVAMLVLGADGAFGEFCGNGALACSAYLHAKYEGPFFLQTPKGSFHMLKEGNQYGVELCLPSLQLEDRFITGPLHGYHYVNMLEPHLLIEKELSDHELQKLGEELNQMKNIFPEGINVNAWHLLDDDSLFVKTYERGVQRLTKSCASGSISCAYFYRKEGSIDVHTPGGKLTVAFTKKKASFKSELQAGSG